MEDKDRKVKQMLIISAIIESVIEGDDVIGTPGGYLYAALMTHGMSLEQFNGLMTGLVNAGTLIKKGECYHATTLGKEYVSAVKRIEERMAS